MKQAPCCSLDSFCVLFYWGCLVALYTGWFLLTTHRHHFLCLLLKSKDHLPSVCPVGLSYFILGIQVSSYRKGGGWSRQVLVKHLVSMRNTRGLTADSESDGVGPLSNKLSEEICMLLDSEWAVLRSKQGTRFPWSLPDKDEHFQSCSVEPADSRELPIEKAHSGFGIPVFLPALQAASHRKGQGTLGVLQ